MADQERRILKKLFIINLIRYSAVALSRSSANPRKIIKGVDVDFSDCRSSLLSYLKPLTHTLQSLVARGPMTAMAELRDFAVQS